MEILAVLVNQLLTFAACRDHIEECSEKLKQAQRDLRAHQNRELRRERDETQYWYFTDTMLHLLLVVVSSGFVQSQANKFQLGCSRALIE